MNVAALQMDIAWEDRPTNHARVRSQVGELQGLDGGLLVLPELFATGFSMETQKTRPGPEWQDAALLRELAHGTGALVIGGSVGARAHHLHNEALVMSPTGDLLARYAKIHPFGPGNEGASYRAGSEVVVVDWAGHRICPLICYDLRFPEVFRAGLDHGATLFVVIASWPARRAQHWMTLLQARAIENQAFVLGVNRCGTDPIGSYSGRSCLVSPHGVVVADAGEIPGMLRATADPELVGRWRTEFPAARDRRWATPRLQDASA
jgi:predicted amidohydrolase